MRRSTIFYVPFALFLPALACNGSNPAPSSPDAALSDCQGQVTIGADFPLSGTQGEAGGYVENGVRLAMEQAQGSRLLGGCTLNYVPKDDASATTKSPDKQQGVANMNAFVADANVVAIIGPYNSGVAAAEIPVTNRAGVLQVTPSATNPALTIVGTDPSIDTASLRPSGNLTFFRVPVNDLLQAKLAAQVAYETLGARKVYDVDDSESYGADISNHFDEYFKARGGAVLRSHVPSSPASDYGAQIEEAKRFGADLVFFGGISESGPGVLRAQLQRTAGAPSKFLTDDGAVTPKFITDAGPAAEGVVATGEANVIDAEPGKTFAAQYRQRFHQDPQEYSPFGYEAARIVLTAIQGVIADNAGKLPAPIGDFRTKVIKKLAATQFDGVLGHTAFDANGDTTNTRFGIYKVANGKWAQQQSVTVPP